MKIVLLPLDSRPCTYEFPKEISTGCGADVVRPPLELMDFYRRPSDAGAISSWLAAECSGADAAVIAVEQLAYGGLIASRDDAVPAEEALRRLDVLSDIKAHSPQLRIFCGSVIMRNTVSIKKKEDQVWWRLVAEYSRASVLAARDPREAARAEALRAQIPAPVLRRYQAARQRNHLVNLKVLGLAAAGVAEEVTFLQEDSMPDGPQTAEQDELLRRAAGLGISERVHLHNGTDEYVCAVTGRLLAESGGARPSVGFVWLGGDNPGFIAAYEDRPFLQNLSGYSGTCRLNAADPGDADMTVLIYSPRGKQIDAEISPPGGAPEAESCCREAEDWIGKKRRVALLDIYHANGGENGLMGGLSRRGLLEKLWGYAAWNTASNSLGTLLGQILSSACRPSGENFRFTRERCLDDWIYQSIVRPELNAHLEAGKLDKYDITDTSGFEALLRDSMAEAAAAHGIPAGSFEARLRWPRTFEISVSVPPQIP